MTDKQWHAHHLAVQIEKRDKAQAEGKEILVRYYQQTADYHMAKLAATIGG